MKFIKENLHVILLALFLISSVQQCTNSRRLAKIEKQQKALVERIDSTYTVSLQRAVEIEGLKISKRTLYDWNSVVRTAVRPDDRMNEYDKQIDLLQKSK